MLASIIAIVLMVTAASLEPAQAAPEPGKPEPTGAVTVPDAGVAEDSEAITAAARSYDSREPASVGRLVNAASAADAIPMEAAHGKYISRGEDGAQVVVGNDAKVSLTTPAGMQVSVAMKKWVGWFEPHAGGRSRHPAWCAGY